MLKVGKTLRENFSGINLKPELFSLHQQQAKGQYKVGVLEILLLALYKFKIPGKLTLLDVKQAKQASHKVMPQEILAHRMFDR